MRSVVVAHVTVFAVVAAAAVVVLAVEWGTNSIKENKLLLISLSLEELCSKFFLVNVFVWESMEVFLLG